MSKNSKQTSLNSFENSTTESPPKKKKNSPQNLDPDLYQNGFKKTTWLMVLSMASGIFIYGILISTQFHSQIWRFISNRFFSSTSDLSRQSQPYDAYSPIDNWIMENVPQVSYQKSSISFFPPSLIMHQTSISISDSTDLFLGEVPISIIRPSIWPFGIRTRILLQPQNTQLKIELNPGVPFHLLQIEGFLDTQTFLPLISDDLNIQSDIKTLIHLNLNSQFLAKSGQILLESTEITIPSQKIQGFEIPSLKLTGFNLRVFIEDTQNWKLEEFFVGGPNDPLQLKLNGKMKVNKNDFLNSSLDLNLEFNILPKFLEEHSFLNLLLGQVKKKAGGTYYLKIKGTLRKIQPIF